MAKKEKRDTFERHLKVYSAAAAGVLALAPSAEAAVQYSGVQNLPVNSSTSQNIDLNSDGTNDFSFNPINYPTVHLIEMNGGANAFIGTQRGNSDAANLPSNYLIGPTLAGTRIYWRTVGYSTTLNGTQSGAVGTNGNFNNTTGFISVRFHSTACQGSDWNYGWIQYQGFTTLNSAQSGTIIDWAYEDSCNTPITTPAGEPPQPAKVPTLNQWGIITLILLLGGLAARMLRKQEEES